jgi:hypothetical protein
LVAAPFTGVAVPVAIGAEPLETGDATFATGVTPFGTGAVLLACGAVVACATGALLEVLMLGVASGTVFAGVAGATKTVMVPFTSFFCFLDDVALRRGRTRPPGRRMSAQARPSAKPVRTIVMSTAKKSAPPPLAQLARRASEIPEEKIEWLWKSRFPMGKIALIDGDPDANKSTFVYWVAAIATKLDQVSFPFGGSCLHSPLNVLMYERRNREPFRALRGEIEAPALREIPCDFTP